MSITQESPQTLTVQSTTRSSAQRAAKAKAATGPVSAIESTIHALERVVDVSGRLAAWTCVMLVLLVAANVFARYFFSTGAIWLRELEWHLISPIALLGMSFALMKGEQVRVDVLFERMPPRLQAVIEIVTGLLIVAISVILVKLSVPFVEQAWRTGENSPNPGGMPHRFALKAFIPIGFALLALQGLCHTLRYALKLATGR